MRSNSTAPADSSMGEAKRRQQRDPNWGKPKPTPEALPDWFDREAYESFLRVNLEPIAAVAWNGYLNEGRGLVLFNPARSQQNASATRKSLVYIGERNPVFQAKFGGKWIDTTTAQKVEQYDPNEALVLAIAYGNRGFITQTLGSSSFTPQQAWERLKHRLDEFALSAQEFFS